MPRWPLFQARWCRVSAILPIVESRAKWGARSVWTTPRRANHVLLVSRKRVHPLMTA
jgi:hypothetical protein